MQVTRDLRETSRPGSILLVRGRRYRRHWLSPMISMPLEHRYMYDSMAVSQYGSMAVSQYGSMAVSQYGSMAVSLYGSMAVSLYGSITVWQYHSITV